MKVLGLHRDPWHNTGAAIVAKIGNQTAIANLAEERLNREKDSRKFPELSTLACMKELGIKSYDEIDLVVLDYIVNRDWQNDFHKVRGISGTFLDSFPPDKIKVINHHLAHAYNVYYSSPFKEAAILIVDGRGSEKETQSLFMATPDRIELIESTKAIGIGLLYAAVTQKAGFAILEEGKTMGLAPYGQHITKNLITFPHKFNGVETDYREICLEDSYEMRIPDLKIETFEDKARIAFEVQEECEFALAHLASYAKKVTKAKYLCISGGVGLNSVANYKLLRSGIFEDVFVNPAASDTGIPLGAALYGYHSIGKMPKDYKTISAYLGPTYSSSEIDQAIAQFSGSDIVSGDDAAEKAAELLAANFIVGNFQGRSEMGPRALGNRSILMSPIKAENKDTLNHRVKHREGFRPFAPAIMYEHLEEYFVFDRENPYMLMVAEIREDKRAVIPAVTHVDGTGRLQTVSKESNAKFYEIISKFYKLTGVPVILNTSFNVAGEPIVETPADTIRCFLSTEIDALLLEKTLLIKKK